MDFIKEYLLFILLKISQEKNNDSQKIILSNNNVYRIWGSSIVKEIDHDCIIKSTLKPANNNSNYYLMK